MKSKILFFFFISVFFTSNVNAQNEDELRKAEYKRIMPLLHATFDKAFRAKDVQIFNTLIDTLNIKNATNKNVVFSSKAFLIAKINKKELKDTPNLKDDYPLVKTILDNFQQSIDACEKCALKNKMYRYEFLENYDINSSFLESDFPVLKAAGYKEDITGRHVGLSVFQGKNTWVGAELALYSHLSPFYRLKQLNEKTNQKETIHRNIPAAISAFSFAYAFNVQEKLSDFNFNLIQVTSPFVIKPLQFGMQTGKRDKGVSGYYRPELGFGFGRVSVAAAYNIMFNKAARADAEKWMLTARFIYPIDGE